MKLKIVVGIFIILTFSCIFSYLSLDQEYLKQTAPDKWVHWVSVLPPLIAIVLAYLTGEIISALFVAVLLGGFIASPKNPFLALKLSFFDFMWKSVQDEFHILVVVFIITLVGMVAVMSRMGGTQAIINVFSKKVGTGRGAEIITALLGIFIFFDDYANTILVGSSARPLTDKYRVSREKLAYLVDSTAAPVAGLAVLSTWIGYEVGLFQTVLSEMHLNISGYEAFFRALPFRFYCIFTIFFVFLNVILGRDFGSMLKAQKRAYHENKLYADDAEFKTSIAVEKTTMHHGVKPKLRNATLPLIVVILVIWVGLYLSGMRNMSSSGLTGGSLSIIHLFSFDIMRQCFSNADNLFVLAMSGVIGSLVALFLAVSQKILSFKESLATWSSSFKAIISPLCILILAWSIQRVCDHLGTSLFLTATLKNFVSPGFLPLLIFILAGVIAFATGTSWGTMAILIPTAIPLTYHMGGLELTFISMAAVLDGAIFGDHCSPVSDTTLMSSIASACDHMHHVKTQLPYALVCMVLSSTLGYYLSISGIHVVISYVLGGLASFFILMFIGKRVRT
ncbi:MAG: Na+/H+ antiporter NhaC family protein [Deltaproteobacteria bacterium]|nr:Na+/H+ antiporter NhaC family protein [Deltaproteobacteria bacterium]